MIRRSGDAHHQSRKGLPRHCESTRIRREGRGQRSLAGSNPADDGSTDILEDFADDPTRQELIEFIRGMDEDEQVELVALSWLGRGTYEFSEWNEALDEARAAHNERTAEYMIGLPLLGNYLEEGLAAFDESCEDFEKNRL